MHAQAPGLTSDPASLPPTPQSLTPDPAPRPRRRYTVSEKVLAANRLNLEKAVRAATTRRRLGLRTNAEEEAWRQNLLRARQVLHEDRTWKYATCFRHGLTALSLERSLVLAGESAESTASILPASTAWCKEWSPDLSPIPPSSPAPLPSSPGAGCAPCASTASGPSGRWSTSSSRPSTPARGRDKEMAHNHPALARMLRPPTAWAISVPIPCSCSASGSKTQAAIGWAPGARSPV